MRPAVEAREQAEVQPVAVVQPVVEAQARARAVAGVPAAAVVAPTAVIVSAVPEAASAAWAGAQAARAPFDATGHRPRSRRRTSVASRWRVVRPFESC